MSSSKKKRINLDESGKNELQMEQISISSYKKDHIQYSRSAFDKILDDNRLKRNFRIERSLWWLRKMSQIITQIINLSRQPRTNNNSHNPKILGFLKIFYWFCGKDSREEVKFITADLKRDTRAMREEGRSWTFIYAVLVWHIFPGTIFPIMWRGLMKFLRAVLPIGHLIEKVKKIG